MKRVIRRIVGVRFLFALAEACTRVAREYFEIAAAQAGEQRWFACGIWLGGIMPGEIDKVRATLDHPGGLRSGWWDSVPPQRRCLFMALTVEASTPERASLRCMEELARRFEQQGVSTAESVRVEVEPLPAEYVPKRGPNA